MATLRERMARRLMRPEFDRLSHNLRFLDQVLDKRQWLLEDVDVQEAIDLNPRSIHHRRDVLLTGAGNSTEAERLQAVAESRRLYRRTPLGSRLVGIWTDFGFGLNVEITPRGEEAERVWSEFWADRRNRPMLKSRDLHVLSDAVLTDGELFFVAYADKTTGKTTIRRRPSEEWSEIVSDPDDESVPLFYKRRWTDANSGSLREEDLYYRDWLFDEGNGNVPSLLDDEPNDEWMPADDERADRQDPDTDVVVLHAARNEDDNGRGWPMLYPGAFWIRAYRKTTLDLMSVTEANAQYSRQHEVSGGSRAVNQLRDFLQSAWTDVDADEETNPPPSAGSAYITNEQERLNEVPLNRAVSEGKNIMDVLIGQAGLAGGLYPHWLGRGEAFRLATASSMETPVLRQFTRYQNWWADVWRDMAQMVLWFAQEYGGAVYVDEDGLPIDAFEVPVDVSTDAVIEQDLADFSQALTLLAPYARDSKTLSRLALQALNVPEMQEILDKLYPPETEPGPTERKISRADWDVIKATLRNVVNEELDDGNGKVLLSQALGVMEGADGSSGDSNS